MKQKITALLTILLTFCSSLLAQLPQVRNFTFADYHGGSQNWAIAEGPSNRMLFGNNHGLMVFDGNQWTKHYVSNYSVVRAVMHDSLSQRIYVGASDELGYFDCSQEDYRTTYYSLRHLLPKEQQTFGEVWNIARLGKDIVFQSKTHLFIYNEERHAVSECSNGARIEWMAPTSAGLLVATRKGACRLTAKGLTLLPGTEALGDMVVRAILSSKGDVLFITKDHGVQAYDGIRLTRFETPFGAYLTENQVFCAAARGDVLVFGTVRAGLVAWNRLTGETTYVNRSAGLQNNTVLTLHIDNNMNLWAGLDNGISYLLRESPFTHLLGQNSNIGTGYSATVYDHQLYLGTSQGLFTLPYPSVNSPTPAAPQLVPGTTGQVWTLNLIDGTLFCGMDNGAYTLTGRTATKIAGVEGTWNFRSLGDGRVVAADYSGYAILERRAGGYALRNRIKGLDFSSGNFYIDRDGTLWIGHWLHGVYHVWLNDDLTAVSRQEFFHKDNGLLVDNGNQLCSINGQIYISSVDGLYRYDAATHQLVFDNTMSHIFETYGTSLRIFQTPAGDLWAFKKDYLAFAQRQQDGTYSTNAQAFYNATDQLQMGGDELCALDSTHTLFNALDGFLVFNNRFTDHTQGTTTYVRRVVGTNAADTLLYASLPCTADRKSLSLPHDLNSLRIEFVQTEYRDADAVTYQCRLEGYSNEWSAPQTATSKEYTQLQKGHYTFRVRAFNRISGKTTEATIDIVIRPAWYETWWARTVYALLLAVAVWGAVKWLRHKQEERIRQVKEKKDREMREQQQRNDEEMRLQQQRSEMEMRLQQERNEHEMKMQQERFELEQQRAEMELAKQEHELAQMKSQQLELELKHRQSELADSTMNLMRKNDILQVIDQQMEQLSVSVRREDTKANVIKQIKDIRHDIQQNINEDEGWNRFEENFNLVYENFMQRLTTEFPDLKMSDRKLCAYLRMGLSSKEMASLLNTSVRSIETARYRLRKKLNLEQGDNLSDFIQNY